MNTTCEQVLNYCCSGSRGKNTIRNSILNTISSVLRSRKSLYTMMFTFSMVISDFFLCDNSPLWQYNFLGREYLKRDSLFFDG
jgi:hypothetical protein